MSPPEQTITSRNRLYFSLYYTVSHVFAFMNTFIFWAFVVPKGHGELPKERQRGSGDDAGSLEGMFLLRLDIPPKAALTRLAGDFLSHGWFEPFCVLNLWGYTSLLALFEIMFLNSIKRQIVSCRVSGVGLHVMTGRLISFIACAHPHHWLGSPAVCLPWLGCL